MFSDARITLLLDMGLTSIIELEGPFGSSSLLPVAVNRPMGLWDFSACLGPRSRETELLLGMGSLTGPAENRVGCSARLHPSILLHFLSMAKNLHSPPARET